MFETLRKRARNTYIWRMMLSLKKQQIWLVFEPDLLQKRAKTKHLFSKCFTKDILWPED